MTGLVPGWARPAEWMPPGMAWMSCGDWVSPSWGGGCGPCSPDTWARPWPEGPLASLQATGVRRWTCSEAPAPQLGVTPAATPAPSSCGVGCSPYRDHVRLSILLRPAEHPPPSKPSPHVPASEAASWEPTHEGPRRPGPPRENGESVRSVPVLFSASLERRYALCAGEARESQGIGMKRGV